LGLGNDVEYRNIGRKRIMPLNIKNTEADELARRLAKKTGLNLTDVVIHALREQLRREEGRAAAPDLADELLEIGRHCAALPDLDRRGADEILGYDERGIWS
jgi:antitoxin VapB